MGKSRNQRLKDGARFAIAAALIIAESSWHLWNLAIGEWTVQTHLPFHLCAVMLWASVYMLLTRNYRIFEFAYFLGIGGAIQAVLTPEAGVYGFPHYRVFQTLVAHGAIVTAGVFMTAVEGFRPTWGSFWRTVIWLNIYAAVITGVNLLIGSNYLYTIHKPTTASLIDFLGPWPYYLLALEGIAILLCLLLYLPWHIKDRASPAR